jgi:hypothetical protein
MPTNNPISTPAGYAPAFAIGYSDHSGALSVVQADKPLPVSLSAEIPSAPLEGQSSADTLAGPFVPVSGRPVVLTLAGSWEGGVQVQRSVDGGATRHKLTVGGLSWGEFTGNACEPVWSEDEDGAELYLAIAIASGTLEYRLAQ